MPVWDFPRWSRKNKFSFWPYDKSFIEQACSIKMAVYWPRSSCGFINLDFVSAKKIAKTRTWPVSSHIGRTSLVNMNAYSLLYVLKSVKFSNTFFSLDREWFYLLSKEVFNPYYGLFEYSARSVQMMVFDSCERFDHSLFPHAFYA